MRNPSTTTRRAEAQNQAYTANIVPPALPLRQDLEAQSPLPPNGFPERSPLAQAQQLNLLVSDQVTVPVLPCAQCGATQAKQVAGTGPHYAALRCADCDRFIKWLTKPKSGGAE